jgi:alkanesulfonate monooxygenase SsuD/methylene tetrahydromethanopterin reductase-like flavin-dependent oxidoreductase (luciferase family)
VILGVNVVAADTDDEARYLATSGRQAFASLRAGKPIPLPPPSKDWEKEVVPFGGIRLEEVHSVSFVGSRERVVSDMGAFADEMQPDEMIVVSHIYDHGARLRSYELIAPTLLNSAR